MNINKKTKFGIFTILIAFFMLCSMASVFAGSYGGNGFEVNNNEADIFTQLSAKDVSNKIFSIEKNKVPSKYKKYENYTFQVAKGKKIYYKATINTDGDGLATNLKGTKVSRATIDFGDGTKKSGTGYISHAYKKTGYYLIKVTLSGTCTGFDLFGMQCNGTGKIINGTKYYVVYVANKPQLVLTKLTAGYTNQKDYKKGNINFLSVKVSNVGSVSTKATKIKIWYQDPKKFGKVHSKLKSYTVSAKLKALKPGKSTSVRIYFKIPKKLAKYVKNIKLDSVSKNKNQMSRPINLYSFV